MPVSREIFRSDGTASGTYQISQISGGTSFFDRAEIKDVLAYIRLLVNPRDDAAFLRVVNTPRREIGAPQWSMIGLEGVEANVAWAKLRSLVEGAEIASRALW